MDLHFDRFSIITVETWPILRCYVISIKKKETDAYCTLAQFLIPGIVPIVPMFLELLSVLRYYHFLSLSPYLRLLLEQIYSSCTLSPALLATDDFVFFPFEREEGRKEGTRPLDPRRGKQPLSFLLFFFFSRSRRRSRGKWEPLAATCDTWSFPRCSTAARPRTRVSGHVFHTVT